MPRKQSTTPTHKLTMPNSLHAVAEDSANDFFESDDAGGWNMSSDGIPTPKSVLSLFSNTTSSKQKNTHMFRLDIDGMK